MSGNFKSLIRVALCCMFAGLSQAAQVTYSDTASGSIGAALAVNVQQFDSSLGTLTGVTLSIVTGSESANLRLYNSSANDATWSVSLSNGTITFSDATQSTVASLSYSGNHVAFANTTTTIPVVTSSGTASQTYSPLAKYIGNGTVSGMSVTFAGTWGAGNMGDNDTFGVNSFVGTATWSVTYTYESVPEPTSLGLLALGVMAVGLRRRFKKTA